MIKKKEYESPKIEIIKFKTEDIILLSGDSWNLSGEDGKPESGHMDVFSL